MNWTGRFPLSQPSLTPTTRMLHRRDLASKSSALSFSVVISFFILVTSCSSVVTASDCSPAAVSRCCTAGLGYLISLLKLTLQGLNLSVQFHTLCFCPLVDFSNQFVSQITYGLYHCNLVRGLIATLGRGSLRAVISVSLSRVCQAFRRFSLFNSNQTVMPVDSRL